jgi:hypothetical protein
LPEGTEENHSKIGRMYSVPAWMLID